MQYQILTAERPDALTGKVNEALTSGWELHGSTGVASSGSNLIYSQALVLIPKEQLSRH